MNNTMKNIIKVTSASAMTLLGAGCVSTADEERISERFFTCI